MEGEQRLRGSRDGNRESGKCLVVDNRSCRKRVHHTTLVLTVSNRIICNFYKSAVNHL